MTPSASRRALRIASRNSPLALWQAGFVKNELQKNNPDLQISILGITTQGDQLLDVTLSKVGGKGLFVKELEVALLTNMADIAVHSMKDVPTILPEGLIIPVICDREDASDALISSRYESLEEMPHGTTIGTSSLRRKCQLLARYPQFDVQDLRGNVNTRLAKLDDGEYDAIILATAGLIRLGLAQRISQKIPLDISLPAAGQGALGIQCRSSDNITITLLKNLHHVNTAAAVRSERAVIHKLQGGCQAPVACYATITDDHLVLRALVGSTDGKTIFYEETAGHARDGEHLGTTLAERLLAMGADRILADLR